jgi:hypothetical protein
MIYKVVVSNPIKKASYTIYLDSDNEYERKRLSFFKSKALLNSKDYVVMFYKANEDEITTYNTNKELDRKWCEEMERLEIVNEN